MRNEQNSSRSDQGSFSLRLTLACGLLLAGALILLGDLVWQNEAVKSAGLFLLVLFAAAYYLQRWRDRKNRRRSAGEKALSQTGTSGDPRVDD
ncbi:hypothetical protein ACTL6U_12240 [Rhodovibrionaceae bacterium A322]